MLASFARLHSTKSAIFGLGSWGPLLTKSWIRTWDITPDTDLHSVSIGLSYYVGMVIYNFNVPPLAAVSTVTQEIVQ